MITQKKIAILLMILCFLFASIGCSSIPKEIPSDITIEELTREAQNAFDRGQYKLAEHYYNAAISRAINNPQQLLFVEYELAHMYTKQKKYDLALPILERLKSYYENPTEIQYPAAYKKLIEININKIKEGSKKTK